MSNSIEKLRNDRLELLLLLREKERRQREPLPEYRRHGRDPVGYVRDVLGSNPTPDQERILKSLLIPPCRVLVPSGHDTGKTWTAGAAINWWYDSFDPGAVFSLGPRHDSLKETIWSEVRMQRLRARVALPDHFIGPSAPEMRSSPEHWAKALTAAKDASLTGRHLPRMLFVVEEACAVDPIFWEVVKTMFDPSLGHAWLCIFNPTDTTSAAYQEDLKCDDASGSPRWHRIRLSALDHPNVESELNGRGKVVPNAISIRTIEDEWLRDWCEPIGERDDVLATDVEWPPSKITGRPGKWYRPGPLFQARGQGLWPDTGSGVWSPILWEAATKPLPPTEGTPRHWRIDRSPEIGCDCSTGKGEDFFAWHARWGPVSTHHETSNTMDPARIAARLKEACAVVCDFANRHIERGREPWKPQQIPVKIDDDGVGCSVSAFLRAAGYLAIPVGAGTSAADPERYPRKRDELWFQSAAKAKAGLVNVSLLDATTRARLRQQLLAPVWKVDQAGRRQVEKKDDTKEKIGRSPDDADALNLAFADYSDTMSVVDRTPQSGMGTPERSRSPWGAGRR